MKGVVSAILGGGQGTRLWPLTRDRAKPAVPIGGKFRLIDIPISNSLHAGIDQVYVLTQFNTASLHRHIAQTYRFDVFSSGFVNILAAEQSLENRDWYQGTADAVRHNLHRLMDPHWDEVLILSGDQIYLMDLPGFITWHRETEADFTVAVKPVSREEAPGLGIMRLDRDGRIVEFVEKPKDPQVLDAFTLDEATISSLDLDARPGQLLASMGIYVFRSGVLRELLEGTTPTDFGREIIPAAIGEARVFGFVHSGYWRDIGTIGAFHEANLELTDPVPEFNLYSAERPIYTHPRFLPGCKVNNCDIHTTILGDGSVISRSRIRRSVIGIRARIREGTEIEESVVMGAGVFEGSFEKSGEGTSEAADEDRIPMGVGRHCRIRRAIVDLNSRIGDGCRLVNEAGVTETDGDGYCIRDGIIVVFRGAEIPAGTVV